MFDINVSLNGRHFFAIHERSVRDTSTAKKVLKVFKEKFPEAEGYSISISFRPNQGYGIDIDGDIEKEVDDIYSKLSR